MQERRTSIRMAHAVAAQYCPSDDLLPRDGKLLDVSERGSRLKAREPRQVGDRITVTFPLEQEQEPLTVTGEVRWQGIQVEHRREPRLGVLPLLFHPSREVVLDARVVCHSALQSASLGLDAARRDRDVESGQVWPEHLVRKRLLGLSLDDQDESDAHWGLPPRTFFSQSSLRRKSSSRGA